MSDAIQINEDEKNSGRRYLAQKDDHQRKHNSTTNKNTYCFRCLFQSDSRRDKSKIKSNCDRSDDQMHCNGNVNKTCDIIKIIVLGQIISIANACTGAASTTLAEECKINSPAAQSGLMYMLLSGFILLLPREEAHHNSNSKQNPRDLESDTVIRENVGNNDEVPSHRENQSYNLNRLPFTKIKLQAPWFYYAILAFLDLQANYVTYYAYRYTSFTSIALLDSLSIPSVMIFSRVLLNRRYRIWHFLGISICLIGFVMTVKSDISDTQEQTKSNITISDSYDFENTIHQVIRDQSQDNKVQNYPHALRGDLLAICGAILYGLNDALTERSVKQFSVVEFLGMLGFFGMIFSILQIIVLEPNILSLVFQSQLLSSSSSSSSPPLSPSCSSYTPILLLVWNAVSLTLFYIGASYFLIHNDAAMLDISLLTTNIYAIVFVVWSKKSIPPHPLEYFISLVLVVFGVFVYETGSSLLLPHVTDIEKAERRNGGENSGRDLVTKKSNIIGYGAVDDLCM